MVSTRFETVAFPSGRDARANDEHGWGDAVGEGNLRHEVGFLVILYPRQRKGKTVKTEK
jgi:hypothetical protein